MMPGKQYFTVTDGVTGLPTWLWRVIETKIIVGSAAMAAVTGVGVAVGCGRATASLDSSLGGDLPSNNADTGSPAASPRASLGPQTYQVPGYSVQPFVRALEHFTILPSPGSQDGEPFGEEPPGVWGSLDGHLPWETALREPSRLVQTGSRLTSHRGGRQSVCSALRCDSSW
jgi:hypothetical protein